MTVWVHNQLHIYAVKTRTSNFDTEIKFGTEKWNLNYIKKYTNIKTLAGKNFFDTEKKHWNWKKFYWNLKCKRWHENNPHLKKQRFSMPVHHLHWQYFYFCSFWGMGGGFGMSVSRQLLSCPGRVSMMLWYLKSLFKDIMAAQMEFLNHNWVYFSSTLCFLVTYLDW